MEDKVNETQELRRYADGLREVVHAVQQGWSPDELPVYGELTGWLREGFDVRARASDLGKSKLPTEERLKVLEDLVTTVRQLREALQATSNPALLPLFAPGLESELVGEELAARMGIALGSARRGSEWNLRDVGQMVAVTPSYLSQLERGRTLPSHDRARQLDRVLEPGRDPVLAEHGESLAGALEWLREERDRIAESEDAISHTVRGPRGPLATADPSSGPQSLSRHHDEVPRDLATDPFVLDGLADPQIRKLLFMVVGLPSDIRRSVVDLVASIHRDVHAQGRPRGVDGRNIVPERLWLQERGLPGLPVEHWQIGSVLLELIDLIGPRTMDHTSEPIQRLHELRRALDRRHIDSLDLIRKTLIGRATRRILGNWRLGVAEHLGISQSLKEWLAANGEQSQGWLIGSLARYWETLELEDLLQQPPPPPGTFRSLPPMREPDQVQEWFVDRLTARSPRSWSTQSLRMELAATEGAWEVEEPWALALRNQVVSGDEVQAELSRRDARRTRHGRTEELPREARVSDSMIGGFVAFGAGHYDEAESAFRTAVQHFPESAQAHNNLGFVMMVNRKHGEADRDRTARLETAADELQRSQTLGYEEPAISDSNLGSCLYLLGRHREALDTFHRALGRRDFAGGTLTAIVRDTVEPLQLDSAAQYFALISLNAGWAAARLGDIAAANQHYLRATASRSSFQVQDDDQQGRRRGRGVSGAWRAQGVFDSAVTALREWVESQGSPDTEQS